MADLCYLGKISSDAQLLALVSLPEPFIPSHLQLGSWPCQHWGHQGKGQHKGKGWHKGNGVAQGERVAQGEGMAQGKGVAQGGVWAQLCLSIEGLMVLSKVWGLPGGSGLGTVMGGGPNCAGVALSVQGCACPQAAEGDSLRLQEPLLQLASTACSTSQLCCASLAGTCFSINLGGRESLAEPWAAGKDLQLLWLLYVLLAGLGLLQKCPEGGGGDGGGNPCWPPSREQGPRQRWIRGAGAGRMNRTSSVHPWICGNPKAVKAGAGTVG